MAAEAVDRQTGEERAQVLAFPAVRIDPRFVSNDRGREYVLSAGLLQGLHQLSGGCFEVETRLEQLPTADNGMLAVCGAKVTVYAPDGERVLRSATGIGDASPSSVNRMIAPHLVRMAETRALNRALRTLLNVGAVSFEELGGEEPEAPVERIQIRGQWYTRPQVVAGYKKVVAEAQAVGLAIPPGDVVADEAPLPVLAGAAQGLRTRLDARDGKDR